MIADMIAVGVGDKGKGLALPWIKPQGLGRQFEAAMEPDGNQGGRVNRKEGAVQ